MVTIERARVEDVLEIKQVLSETWIATYGDHLSPSAIEHVTTQWHDPELLKSQIERPGDYFAVAKTDDTIVGLIAVTVLSRVELFLPRLYVGPAYQGRGIGTCLFNAAIASYPDAKVVRLAVEKANSRGQAFWRRHGFIETGSDTVQVVEDSIAVITMERRLQ